MDQKFYCSELVFTHIDEISVGIDKWFENNPAIEEVHSVSNFITAVQAPGSSFAANAGQQPTVQYQFRFVIIYS